MGQMGWEWLLAHPCDSAGRKMLIKALEALEKVKKQWEDGEVSPNDLQLNQILPDLSVKVFVEMADGNQKISSYSSKVFAADLTYRHVFNASSTVQLVAMISKAYHTSVTKVSDGPREQLLLLPCYGS
uniref:Uncharacterized protein n=1 Tax=Sphaerodactylus townsendi TaxID=933632 RepID=A0ACB8EHZ6_9SAUR